MSSSIRKFTEDLRKMSHNSSPKDHAGMIGTMAQEIANYVEEIRKEDMLAKQVNTLSRQVKQKPETEEEERELLDLREALQAAKDAEKHIYEKRQYLRRLETVIQGLLSNIRRAL